MKYYCDNLHASNEMGSCIFCESKARWPEMMVEALKEDVFTTFEESELTGIEEYNNITFESLVTMFANKDRTDDCVWKISIRLPEQEVEEGAEPQERIEGGMLRCGFDIIPFCYEDEWEACWDEVKKSL